MNSLILCEGKTDCILLQYYMEKAHNWERVSKSQFGISKAFWSNSFVKNNDSLIIAETGGCNRLVDGLKTAIQRNEQAAPDKEQDFLDRIVIFTDNDDECSEDNLKTQIYGLMKDTSLRIKSELIRGAWNRCEVMSIGGIKEFELLIIFVPFDEHGALETYMLQCISENDSYDKEIIDKGNIFVDTVDPEGRYLAKRRTKTKAKFDVYFSVRTSVDQFKERQNILKSVPWENYDKIREDFKKLEELG